MNKSKEYRQKLLGESKVLGSDTLDEMLMDWWRKVAQSVHKGLQKRRDLPDNIEFDEFEKYGSPSFAFGFSGTNKPKGKVKFNLNKRRKSLTVRIWDTEDETLGGWDVEETYPVWNLIEKEITVGKISGKTTSWLVEEINENWG